VVVWEPAPAIELVAAPDFVPAPIDIRTALELEEKLYESARRLAEHGAGLARDAGFEAEALAVVDDITVAATLVRLARERDAPAMVVGTRGHGGLTHVLLGSTAEQVVRRAPCPVVVRGPGDNEE
jgi:nucleotide-binding universal stress UspA family protein